MMSVLDSGQVMRKALFCFSAILSVVSMLEASLANASLSQFESIKNKIKGEMKVRVLVGSGLSEISLSGNNLRKNIIFNHDQKFYRGHKKLKFNCRSLTKNGGKAKGPPILFASLSSNLGKIEFEENIYQGEINILARKGENNCDVVNVSPLESYLETLLAKEMNGSWPVEVLKAQAVAARSYALHKIYFGQVSKEAGHEAYYDLENSEKHQVSGTLRDITKRTKEATTETRGEILVTKEGNLVPIFFHAQCGGHTLLPDEVWENHVEGYKGVRCIGCEHKGGKIWKEGITLLRFRSFLNWMADNNYVSHDVKVDVTNEKILISPDKLSYNRLRIYIGNKLLMISKTLLRKYFGRFIIPSNNFQVSLQQSQIQINGMGNGHGVGLCQVGALDLAERGWDYKKILAYYFPGHRLENIY